MFRLLIVDDEPVIREGLREGFDWNRVGFEICGTACDGAQAVEMINQQHPDVVLTDITMANMDGIALLEYISSHHLPIRTIVLSGYDNFEFARKAMEYGASNYLLKPLDDEAVYLLFEKIRQELRQKKIAAQLEAHMQRGIPQTKEALLEKTLYDYVTGQQEAEKSAQFLLKHYGYPFQSCGVYLAYFSCSRKQYFSALESRLRTYMNRILQNQALCCVHHGGMLLLLFLEGSAKSEQAEKLLLGFLRDCDTQPTAPHRAALRVLVSGPVTEFAALPTAFSKLIPNDNQGFYMEYGKLYHQNNVAIPQQTEPISEQDLTIELVKHISQGQPQLLHVPLRQYFQRMAIDIACRELVVAKTTEVYCKVAGSLKDQQEALNTLSFERLYHHLSDCCSFQELTEGFTLVMDELCADFLQLISSDFDIVGDIQEYISQHYHQKCSLTELAKQFYLHPTYLSALFCRKTGVTLSTYLKDIRMRRAKQLLRDTPHSVLEISQMVGYSDYRYFCNLFKESFQQTPMQYRVVNRSTANKTMG